MHYEELAEEDALEMSLVVGHSLNKKRVLALGR